MYSDFLKPRFLVLTGFVFLAALARFIPHPPNFAPIAALALFGGRYFSDKKFAFLIPITAMLITDSVLGFHYLMPAVYLSFSLIVLVGIFLRKWNKTSGIVAGSVVASTLFFIITNFSEWAVGIIYPKTISGLVMCFTAAIPFYFSSLIGDLFYVSVMFISFELLSKRFLVLAEA